MVGHKHVDTLTHAHSRYLVHTYRLHLWREIIQAIYNTLLYTPTHRNGKHLAIVSITTVIAEASIAHVAAMWTSRRCAHLGTYYLPTMYVPGRLAYESATRGSRTRQAAIGLMCLQKWSAVGRSGGGSCWRTTSGRRMRLLPLVLADQSAATIGPRDFYSVYLVYIVTSLFLPINSSSSTCTRP